MKTTAILSAAAVALAVAATSHAAYEAPGHGLQTVHAGTINNGALYFATSATWTNSAPTQPYAVATTFTMPTADDIVLGRLIMTVWGGSAHRTNVMDITVNGTSLVGGAWTFGTTSDANPVFSSTQPSAYGSGSGVWLVSVPITPSLLNTDGTANIIQINEVSPTFDGRIVQLSLVSVYQDAALNNRFQYAIAEGSGDVYADPASGAGRVDAREISFGGLTLTDPTLARLTALYTYGDAGQNDRLFFNGTQLGDDNLATWAPNGTGLSYGPDVVSFDVLGLLGAETNDLRFSVSASDVPGTRETSLRPQIALWEATEIIPEPSTFLLVSLGLGVLGWTRRHRS